MAAAFSYRHLYYFWVVAKEGGIARAAARLDMAIQTVSTQVRELERALGCALLKPSGRGVTLTEAGIAAAKQADQIFQLGEQLPAVVRDAVSSPSLRLAVGVSDSLPKLVALRLLQPVIAEPNLRLVCHEGEFDDLLADLALHRLDLVFADRAAAPNDNVRVYNHPLGASPLAWYAPPSLYPAVRKEFPRCLERVPILLPTTHVAARARLDRWMAQAGIRPRIAGEFEDSALLKTFGASGMGVFPAAEWSHEELVRRYALKKVGVCGDVEQHFFAIGTEKKVQHPLVQRLIPSRR
jgi:LysR family transcriptional activator of nhaA